jgi:hypothetical protein
MNANDLNNLLKNPQAMMRFHATGRLPQPKVPSSPLITLLESLHPRERIRIKELRMAPSLGYNGHQVFRSAEQALNWLKPAHVQHSSISESHKLARFSSPLTIADLATCAQVPDDIIEQWNARHGVRKPRHAGPSEPSL